MKIPSRNLALLSFIVFSIKNYHAYPYSNLTQTSSFRTTPNSAERYVSMTETFIRTSTTSSSKLRHRYNYKNRFRNKFLTPQPVSSTKKDEKSSIIYKIDDMYKAIRDFAHIQTPLNRTPIFELNITVPKALLEGKVTRIASPFIFRVTLPRKGQPKSNATLPHRGFLRIEGSGVNMLKEGNLMMILGKIANQVAQAYNLTGNDFGKMKHILVFGPGGKPMLKRQTPPRTPSTKTSPIVMTARVRLRLNCTLPRITDQIIFVEDYIKYFELY